MRIQTRSQRGKYHWFTSLILTSNLLGCQTDGARENEPFQASEQSATASQALLVVDTVSELETTVPGAGVTIATVKGYSNAGDGGGGTFQWRTGCPAHDGGIVLVSTQSPTYCWQRIYSGAIDVRWFGVVCDGTTDVTAKANQAFDAVSSAGGEVRFPAGTCLVGAPLAPKSRTTVRLNKGTELLKSTTNATHYQVVLIEDVTDVSLEGGTIRGDRAGQHEAGEWGAGVYVSGSSRVRLSDLRIRETRGDGITLQAATGKPISDVLISDVTIDNALRNGVSVVGAERVTFNNITVTNTHGTNPQAGIDFEPDVTGYLNRDILVNNAMMSGNKISITSGGIGTSNVTIVGGHFRDDSGIIVGPNTSNFRVIGANVLSTAGAGTAFGVYPSGTTNTGIDITDSYFSAQTAGVVVDFPVLGVQGMFQRNQIVVAAANSRALRVIAPEVEVLDNRIAITGNGGVTANGSWDDWTHQYGSTVPVGGNRYVNATQPARSIFGIQSNVLKRDEHFEGGYARGLGGPTGPQFMFSDYLTKGSFSSGGGIGGGSTTTSTISLANASAYTIIPFVQGGGENGCDATAVGWKIASVQANSFSVSYTNKCGLPQTFAGTWIATR